MGEGLGLGLGVRAGAVVGGPADAKKDRSITGLSVRSRRWSSARMGLRLHRCGRWQYFPSDLLRPNSSGVPGLSAKSASSSEVQLFCFIWRLRWRRCADLLLTEPSLSSASSAEVRKYLIGCKSRGECPRAPQYGMAPRRLVAAGLCRDGPKRAFSDGLEDAEEEQDVCMDAQEGSCKGPLGDVDDAMASEALSGPVMSLRPWSRFA